tara:strand:+ start:129 stop:890 length:762 start_codon:yes stop_codon:yes gene_type:complete
MANYIDRREPYSRHYTGPKPSGETGKTFEIDYLYSTREGQELGVAHNTQNVPQNLQFREALKYCIGESPYRYAPEHVSDPQSRDMNALHLGVCKGLDCNDEDVKVFPSIQTPADKRGIDFFIIYTDPKTMKDFLVTADLTMYGKDSFAADILVTPTGCAANPQHYKELLKEGDHIGWITMRDKGDPREDSRIRDERAMGTGKVIANIIKEKMRAAKTDNPHPNDAHRIFGSERAEIRRLLEGIIPPHSESSQS